eukprot:547140_1
MAEKKHTTKQTIVGSMMVALGMFFFGTEEVALKYYNVEVIVLALIQNGVVFICAVMYWVIMPKSSTVNHWYGDTKHDRLNIWFRGLFMTALPIFFYACIRLPLGDLQTILYQAPLWIVYLSYLLFNEQLPPWHILIPSTLFTIIGVMFVSQPGFIFNSVQGLNFDGLLAVIISCVRWIACVLLVKTAHSVHFIQYEFSTTICSFCTYPLLLIVCTYYLDNEFLGTFTDIYSSKMSHVLASVYCGFAGFLAMMLNVKGYQIGNATIVSWLEYINIPISFLYQTYIFLDTPNQYECIGAVLVLVGCLLPVMHTTWIYIKEIKENKRSNILYDRVEMESVTEHESQSSSAHF